ncbi:MAG: 3-deoxy-D-manno-octulosonic acid transferase [Mucispirillum sp.]|nr:3-deoxy-D-manno-octulosonic acid transferase [Mucispirillum sp.]
MQILLFIYNFILIILTPVLSIAGYFILRKKGKHQHYWERFGFIRINDFKPVKSVWFHCASVGEVRSIKKIADTLRQDNPEISIVISTMTAAGRQAAIDYIQADTAFLLPIENSRAVSMIISYMNVSVLVIVDTELWPNLIFTASSCVPVFLINGRISDKTYKTYKRFKFIFKRVLKRFSAIMTKSELDEERFANILGDSGKIITAGNIKFQERKSKDSVKTIKELENVKFFLSASTHKGEEEIILSWFDGKMAGFDKLIFVPRHIERAVEIKEIIENCGYTVSLYSENDFTKQVMIIDAFGLLEGLYISADKIFIGGSLKKIGGHNIYEALQFEKTVAVGKYMFSFKEIFDEAKEFGLVTVINNKAEAWQFLSKLEKNNNFIDFFNRIDKINQNTVSAITDTINAVINKKGS